MENNKNNGHAVAVAAGAGVGTFLGTVLGRQKQGEAPPPEVDGRLDQMLTLLAAIKGSNDRIVQLLEALTFPALVTEPWKTLEPVLIFDQAVRTPGPFLSNIMVDCSRSKRIVLKFSSSLDQPLTIQPIGNEVQSVVEATGINGPLAVPANTKRSVGLGFSDWQPFIGVQITPAAAPTLGNLKVWLTRQE